MLLLFVNTCSDVAQLGESTHLLLLIELLLELLVVGISLCLAFVQIFAKLTLVVPVLSTQLLVSLHGVGRYLLELPKLFVDILLDLGPLSQEHVPLAHVIDRLIVVVQKVSFDKGTVSHEESFTSTFGVLADLVVGERGILHLLLVSFLLAGAVEPLPMGQGCRMDLSTREQLTECVNKLAHECFRQLLATLGVSEVQAIENCLRYDVIQFLEELLFGCRFKLIALLVFLDQSERDIVGRYAIKQELLMLDELWLGVADLTDDVPESVRNQGISMLQLQELQPMDFRLLLSLVLWFHDERELAITLINRLLLLHRRYSLLYSH